MRFHINSKNKVTRCHRSAGSCYVTSPERHFKSIEQANLYISALFEDPKAKEYLGKSRSKAFRQPHEALTKCGICKIVSGKANSHTIPQSVLEVITSPSDKMLLSPSFFHKALSAAPESSMHGTKRWWGINETLTFRGICRKCDGSVFGYEDFIHSSAWELSQVFMAQIALKNELYLKSYYLKQEHLANLLPSSLLPATKPFHKLVHKVFETSSAIAARTLDYNGGADRIQSKQDIDWYCHLVQMDEVSVNKLKPFVVLYEQKFNYTIPIAVHHSFVIDVFPDNSYYQNPALRTGYSEKIHVGVFPLREGGTNVFVFCDTKGKLGSAWGSKFDDEMIKKWLWVLIARGADEGFAASPYMESSIFRDKSLLFSIQHLSGIAPPSNGLINYTLQTSYSDFVEYYPQLGNIFDPKYRLRVAKLKTKVDLKTLGFPGGAIQADDPSPVLKLKY